MRKKFTEQNLRLSFSSYYYSYYLQPIDSYKGVKVVVANTDGSRQSLIPVSDRHVAFEKKVNEIKMIQHRKAHQKKCFLV